MIKQLSVWILFLCGGASYAQVQHAGWISAFIQTPLHQKFNTYLDAQFKGFDGTALVQTVTIRPGVLFRPNKYWALGAGVAEIWGYKIVGTTSAFIPEKNIWQHIAYSYKWPALHANLRLRMEERFLPQVSTVNNKLQVEQYKPAYRINYSTRAILPLKHQSNFDEGWYGAVQDELYLNIGNKAVVNNALFDQNRVYAGFGYRLPLKIDVEADYIYIHVKTKAAYTNTHVAHLAFYKRI